MKYDKQIMSVDYIQGTPIRNLSLLLLYMELTWTWKQLEDDRPTLTNL